ncbi:SCO family protein [Aciduricibacillus chroicocephali]|uniref:SCO family protein n=1 Tax=Aciduricibacillus chroicocephali TaxID=3054939 RepID=A0ABY9KT84_9BACI|nr:SCO family protein [Bacillaceae bacterium 44XB]
MKIYKIIPLLAILLLAACGQSKIETNMSVDVKSFEYRNQDGNKFGLKDLKGNWWVADFIFTNCTTVCLPMTSNMKQLQNRAAKENVDVQLVSFSIDPDRDKPDVLKKYAKSYNADTKNWNFLTGYDFNTIKELSVLSFKSLAEKPPEGTDTDQFTHGTSFFLVNPDGKVIKRYDGSDNKSIDAIVDDLKKVQ